VTLAAAAVSPSDIQPVTDARFALQLAIANKDLPMLTELWMGDVNQ
jgi:hypothetical protein